MRRVKIKRALPKRKFTAQEVVEAWEAGYARGVWEEYGSSIGAEPPRSAKEYVRDIG